jgi:hypothetical protein
MLALHSTTSFSLVVVPFAASSMLSNVALWENQTKLVISFSLLSPFSLLISFLQYYISPYFDRAYHTRCYTIAITRSSYAHTIARSSYTHAIARSPYTHITLYKSKSGREWARVGESGREWARVGESGREWARVGESGREWVRVGESARVGESG